VNLPTYITLTRILSIPVLTIIALVILIVVAWYMANTRGGREFYAIGSDPDAAELYGLAKTKRVLIAFVASGAASGLGGVLFAARYGTINSQVGDGFELARTRGSLAQDEIVQGEHGLERVTGRSGGTEGGMSTGEILRVRAAMKPISTIPRALRTVDVATGEPAQAINQRSDVCAVPAAGVVAEAMVALVLADAVLEKFGGDSVAETARNVAAYLAALVVS